MTQLWPAELALPEGESGENSKFKPESETGNGIESEKTNAIQAMEIAAMNIGAFKLTEDLQPGVGGRDKNTQQGAHNYLQGGMPLDLLYRVKFNAHLFR